LLAASVLHPDPGAKPLRHNGWSLFPHRRYNVGRSIASAIVTNRLLYWFALARLIRAGRIKLVNAILELAAIISRKVAED
jgi:hypothetical protein